jgi:hypothetical protein
MTRTSLISLACAVAAPLMLATAVLAQGQPQPQGQNQPPQGSQPPAGTQANSNLPPPSGGSGGNAGDGRPYPIAFITSVELLRSDRTGGLDIIRARGLVTSGAWTEPHILPISQGQRSDGVLDLIFQARAPGQAMSTGPFMVVEALLPVANGHPYKSVRVRSGSNAVTLKTLPGFIETAAPKQDCSQCVGKTFQARGATAPAGVAAGDIIREEDLPYRLRVIKPTDGIAHYDVDPNRLTLVLGEDGKIVDAGWD